MATSDALTRAFQLFRDAFPPEPLASIDDARRRDDAFWDHEVFAPPADLVIAEVDAGGVPCLSVNVSGSSSQRVVVWCHGGGFVIGRARSRLRFAADVSRAGDCRVLLVDYRLAPEHKFPIPLHDTVAAFNWAADQVGAGSVVIGGDSAGGNLALATLLQLRDRGLALPAGAVPMSAVTDLTFTGASYDDNVRLEPVAVTRSVYEIMRAGYLPDAHDPTDPLASPLHGDLSGLPPLLVLVGSAETLRDDSVAFAEKAEAAGCRVDLQVWEDMIHFWPMFTSILREARDTIATIGDFVRTVTTPDHEADDQSTEQALLG